MYSLEQASGIAIQPAGHNANIFGAPRGGSGGGPGPPIFGKVSFIFYIVYNVWKNIFEIEFKFNSGRNPTGFWKCGGVCVCVWIEIVAATVFCSAKAPFWIISEAILIPKIYARLQEIASNFSKFSGEAPRRRSRHWRSVRGFAPLPAPFLKFLDPPLAPILYLRCGPWHNERSKR